MRTTPGFFRFVVAGAAAILLAPSVSFSQFDPPPIGGTPSTDPMRLPSASAATAAPRGMNQEAFNTLRTTCERDVPVGKAHGDVCARAASIVMGDEAPEIFRDLSSQLRGKVALRFLEIGLVTSNIAAGRAYDMYSKGDILGLAALGGYTDSFRAQEIFDMMVKRGYAGATLRTALNKVAFFSLSSFTLTSTEAEKKQSCTLAKQMVAEGKLDADSKSYADAITESAFCRNAVEVERQQLQAR